MDKREDGTGFKVIAANVIAIDATRPGRTLVTFDLGDCAQMIPETVAIVRGMRPSDVFKILQDENYARFERAARTKAEGGER